MFLRKKKSDKGSKSCGKSKKGEEKPVYWAPPPLTVKSGVEKVDETQKQDHLEDPFSPHLMYYLKICK